MAKVLPFKGTLYNLDKVRIEDVATPPYDVISPIRQNEYYEKSPYSFVRLDLNKEEAGDDDRSNRYTRAAAILQSWLKKCILVDEVNEAFYIYRQSFNTKRDGLRVRTGLIARVGLEDFENRIILPHEKTLSKPKEDRLNLMRATGADLSQIFGLYKEPGRTIDDIIERTVTSSEPVFLFSDDDGVIHACWRLDDPESCKTITSVLSGKTILIADGHHRYETALAYRDEMRALYPGASADIAWNFVMMTLVNIESGIFIMPIHRILKNHEGLNESLFLEKLADYFDIQRLEGTDAHTHARLLSLMEENLLSHAYGLFLPSSGYCFLTLKDNIKPENVVTETRSDEWKQLDATILHYVILGKILGIPADNFGDYLGFPQDDEEAVECVKLGGCQAAFLLNRVSVGQINRIAANNERMPQKTSYFYPKVWSGLVIYRF